MPYDEQGNYQSPISGKQAAIGAGGIIGAYGVHRGLRRIGAYQGVRGIKRRGRAFWRRRQKAANRGPRALALQKKSMRLGSKRRIARANTRILNVTQGRSPWASKLKGWKSIRTVGKFQKQTGRIGGWARKVRRTVWRLRKLR